MFWFGPEIQCIIKLTSSNADFHCMLLFVASSLGWFESVKLYITVACGHTIYYYSGLWSYYILLQRPVVILYTITVACGHTIYYYSGLWSYYIPLQWPVVIQ